MAANGRLDISTLVLVDGWAYLTRNAAAAWERGCDDLVALGHPRPTITAPDGAYRTLASQRYWKTYWATRGLPQNAATPGDSGHGWATDVDIFNAAKFPHALLVEVFGRYGFTFNVSYESWHMHHDGTEPASLDLAPIKLSIGEHTMVKIVAPTRGQAVLGAGYFRHLNNDEEVHAADLIVDRAVVGTDRQYDVWRAIALFGFGANSADDEAIKAAVAPAK